VNHFHLRRNLIPRGRKRARMCVCAHALVSNVTMRTRILLMTYIQTNTPHTISVTSVLRRLQGNERHADTTLNQKRSPFIFSPLIQQHHVSYSYIQLSKPFRPCTYKSLSFAEELDTTVSGNFPLIRVFRFEHWFKFCSNQQHMFFLHTS